MSPCFSYLRGPSRPPFMFWGGKNRSFSYGFEPGLGVGFGAPGGGGFLWIWTRNSAILAVFLWIWTRIEVPRGWERPWTRGGVVSYGPEPGEGRFRTVFLWIWTRIEVSEGWERPGTGGRSNFSYFRHLGANFPVFCIKMLYFLSGPGLTLLPCVVNRFYVFLQPVGNRFYRF